MKILYVVSRPLEINSSASLRNINTINGLCDLGHEVTIVTGFPDKNHPQYSPVRMHKSALLLHTSPNVEKSLSARFSKNFILKKIKKLVYTYHSRHNIYDSWKYVAGDKIWDKVSGDDSNYDVLISSSDPKSSHLAAERFLQGRKIPWVQIWGDPFTGDITSTNQKNEILRQKEEYRLLCNADKVFYLSELTAIEMRNKYPDFADKIFFMPRPYIREIISPPKDYCGDKLKLAYCGDYNSSVRNIIPLYTAIKETNDVLTICGNSDIDLESLSNIRVLGRVVADKVNEIESEADVLIHLSNLSGTQIPGKIYNYSATNKPVIFILDGESKKIKQCFEKYDRYLFCENTKSGILSALDIIRTGKYPGKLEPVVDFSYQVVLKQLVKV